MTAKRKIPSHTSDTKSDATIKKLLADFADHADEVLRAHEKHEPDLSL